MKKTLAAILLSAGLSLMPLPSAADEAETKQQIDAVASGLVASLPIGKKIVLKTVSPEDSGLPADFLGKLTSDLEAALLVASEFEIDLINRQTTEELWAEAIEFNNADFEALHAASGADVALMLTARATGAGVEIALTAYSLDTADAGKVLASTGSTVLALDMQQNLGVDVNSLNDQMAQVLAEIEKVGQTGGLISDPKTYAEYYHNARILQQRGETDLAMKSYEAALSEGYLFVDPLLDLLDLANARYGEEGAKNYFKKKISENIPEELYSIADLQLNGEPLKYVQPILTGTIKFSPLLAIWSDATFRDWGHSDTLMVGRARTVAANLISNDFKSGKFQTYFIDKIRGASVGKEITQFYSSMMSDQFMVDRMNVSRAEVYFRRYLGICEQPLPVPRETPALDRFSISDQVDRSKPVIVCVRKDAASASTKCVDFRSNGAYLLPVNQDDFTFTVDATYSAESCAAFEFTVGNVCIDSVEYTDINGFKVKSPVLINYDQRADFAPADLDKIVECAGAYLRPRN